MMLSRTLLCSVLLTSVAIAQDRSFGLPPGLELDEKGKLQWTAPSNEVCKSCQGKKTQPCAICDDGRSDCTSCKDRQVPCAACMGKGVVADPFLAMTCTDCSGFRQKVCKGCNGSRFVRAAEAEATKCATCDDAGSLACALCAGRGWLVLPMIDGKDLRQSDKSALLGLRDRLAAAKRDVESLRLDRGLPRHLSGQVNVFARIEAALPIEPNQIDRLDALARNAEASDVEGRRRLSNSYSHALVRYIEDTSNLLRRCLWRLERNDGSSPAPIVFRADRLRFDSWFGREPKSPESMYTLLGRGFFRTPSADDTNDVIAAWLANHPDAIVEGVAKLEGIHFGKPTPPIHYVWVTDAGECLNLHLVEQGCVPAATMVSPIPEFDVPIAAYQSFLRAVLAAEEQARRSERGYWGSAAYHREVNQGRAKTALEAARQSREAGEYEAALEHLRKAVAAGDDDPYTQLEVAECLENLGRREEAAAAYDLAIGDDGWSPGYVEKAKGMLRHLGKDAAMSWLSGLEEKEPRSSKFPSIIGTFLEEAGFPAEAIRHYKRAIDFESEMLGFVFDDKVGFTLDPRAMKEREADYGSFQSKLIDVARCAFRSDDSDTALRYAGLGISLAKQRNRQAGHYSKEEIESGDCEGRFIRARTFLLRGDKKSAKRELDLAKPLVERTYYSGWIDQLAELRKQVEAEK